MAAADRFETTPPPARRERELPASADEAWPLIATTDGLRTWLADEVDVAIEPGASGTLRDGEELREVVVEEVEPGRRVALRWWSEQCGPSLVDLVLEPAGEDRCLLVVSEVPLQLVTVPDAPPAWLAPPATGGPQLAATVRVAVAA